MDTSRILKWGSVAGAIVVLWSFSGHLTSGALALADRLEIRPVTKPELLQLVMDQTQTINEQIQKIQDQQLKITDQLSAIARGQALNDYQSLRAKLDANGGLTIDEQLRLCGSALTLGIRPGAVPGC